MAFEAYRQWFDQWVKTRNPRYLRTAVVCQIIFREHLAQHRAAQNDRRNEWVHERDRRQGGGVTDNGGTGRQASG